jgi:Legionella pneumophila major outer membrane protein precursor
VTAGAESNWDVYRGWGFYGRARLCLLAGRFTSVRTETLGSLTISDTSDNLDAIVPVAEFGLGLRYQGERFFFSAGYEFANWFNMVDGLTGAGSATRRQGSLTLEAVSLKMGFVF